MNRLRVALADGRPAIGHMLLEFGTRGIAKIIEACGLDFVLIDMEHRGVDFGAVADLLIVRVPVTEYRFIARVMDAGAMGVMAPNVRTPEQAREVVAAMRYAPEGMRGLGLGTAHNDYIAPRVPSYLHEANRQNVAICQIESTMGLENLDAIAATPGVDILFLGHFDLTQSMGIVGEFENPRFLEAVRRIAERANAHGKIAGIQPGTASQARQAISLGYRVISMGHDTAVYANALRGMVGGIRNT